MNILIGADVVPTDKNVELFKSGNVNTLIGEGLLASLKEADYRIFNLETPLVDNESPIDKRGPNLIAPTNAINGYVGIHANLVTIANNHILDQGQNGLDSTIKTLRENGIAYVGAGKNLEDAKKPFVFELNQKKIGVYACAEHEFTIAQKDSPGANPYDPLDSFDDVFQLRQKCQYVIVLYHGGREYYRYPSPSLQRVCRKFVEKGADLVICQHSHCIGCEEKYRNGTIVYGQGNFIFDECDDECWKTGLLVQINNETVSYVPIEKNRETVRMAKDENAERILREFKQRSEEIQMTGFIEEKYQQCAEAALSGYLQEFRGIRGSNLPMRILNKITRKRWGKLYMNWLYDERAKRSIINCIECEAHREIVLQGLKTRKEK